MNLESSPKPAGGAGQPAPEPEPENEVGVRRILPIPENRFTESEEEYEEKLAKLKADIQRKPVFLIATHGAYIERNLVKPIPVPKGALIVELATIGEEATCSLGHVDTEMYSTIQNPKILANILTDDEGVTYTSKDLDVLHRAAKYTDKDTYYERLIYIDASDNPEWFFIKRIHNGKITSLDNYREAVVHVSKPPIYGVDINYIIKHILENDPDALVHGAIFINITCGEIAITANKSTIARETDRISEFQEAHKWLLYRPVGLGNSKPIGNTNRIVSPSRLPTRIKPVNYSKQFIRLQRLNKTSTNTENNATLWNSMLEKYGRIINKGYNTNRLNIKEQTSTRVPEGFVEGELIINGKTYIKNRKVKLLRNEIVEKVTELKRLKAIKQLRAHASQIRGKTAKHKPNNVRLTRKAPHSVILTYKKDATLYIVKLKI
jgi:hypothetical protein